MKRLISATVLVLATLVGTACSNNPMAPGSKPATTAPVAAAAPIVITYAINIPDPLIANQLLAQYPDGVQMAPITAQLTWDYTRTYGGSNVYWGVLAPPDNVYLGTAIVVCPVVAAQHLTFTGADWPVVANGLPLTTEFTWLGRFVFTTAGVR